MAASRNFQSHPTHYEAYASRHPLCVFPGLGVKKIAFFKTSSHFLGKTLIAFQPTGLNLSVQISAMKMRELVFNFSCKFRFSSISHLYISSVSFGSRAYYFIPIPLEIHNFFPNIAIRGKEGSLHEILGGSPVYAGLSVNIGVEPVLVLSWPRKETFQGRPEGSIGHMLHNSPYNEMLLAPRIVHSSACTTTGWESV